MNVADFRVGDRVSQRLHLVPRSTKGISNFMNVSTETPSH